MLSDLRLTRLELAHFKNHRKAVFEFAPQLTCITGLNGSGKTNLMDAIYLLALTKSRFLKSDSEVVEHNQPYYRVVGHFTLDGEALNIAAAYPQNGKKTFKVNGSVVERLADHIGTIPVVFVNPDDIPLIKGPSEERRKFFDGMLSQADGIYLHNLLAFNKLLLQRNNLLAHFAERRYYDEALLETYDEQILTYSHALATRRRQAIAEFMPDFVRYYQRLAESREVPEIVYQTQVLDEGFAQSYRAMRPRDVASGRTTLGPHRDEYELLTNRTPARKYGSQGQQKTFLLSMKLAMATALQTRLGRKPLLLLDDILERFDHERIQGLLALGASGELGQVFIPEATGERLKREIEAAGLGEEAAFIELEG